MDEQNLQKGLGSPEGDVAIKSFLNALGTLDDSDAKCGSVHDITDSNNAGEPLQVLIKHEVPESMTFITQSNTGEIDTDNSREDTNWIKIEEAVQEVEEVLDTPRAKKPKRKHQSQTQANTLIVMDNPSLPRKCVVFDPSSQDINKENDTKKSNTPSPNIPQASDVLKHVRPTRATLPFAGPSCSRQNPASAASVAVSRVNWCLNLIFYLT